MFPRISRLAILLLLPGALLAQPFSLDQVSSRFPQQGFEESIRFWIDIFSRYDESDVVLHDRNDVRLIYRVERFSQGIEGNDRERNRQQRHLKLALGDVQAALRELSKGGQPRNELQSEILSQLERIGKRPHEKELRRLAENVRMQRGVRSKFAAGLQRSGQYLPYLEQIFRERGLPVELALLPHVESSFFYGARSRVGASGIWQLMRSTGRAHLKITRQVDERLDPLAASRAAAAILEENYQLLGNWPLAITAYNHGTNGMRRARERHGEDLLEIVENYQSRLFGFASKNFYAEFLAAVYLARNQTHFFPEVTVDPMLEFDELHLARGYRIRDLAGTGPLNLEVLQQLNPHLTSAVWSSGMFPAGIDLRVPAGAGEPVRAELANLSTAGSRRAAGESEGDGRYRVRRGDTLAGIARRFGTSEAALQDSNGIADKHRINEGQILNVPTGTGSDGATHYIVERGDNLAQIARQFGTTVGNLQEINGIRDSNQIYPGQRLLLRGTLTYRVQRGDTLARIAQRFKTSISLLKEANGIGNANRIYQGQMLQIPAGH